MEYRITKSQYDYVVNRLLETYLGGIYSEKKQSYYELFTKQNNENFADIWIRGKGSKCKKDLVIHTDISAILTRFVPVIKKKRFGKLLIKYIFEQTGVLADCVDYDYDFTLKKYIPSDEYDDPDEDDPDQDDFFYKSKNYQKKIKSKKMK